MGFEGPDTNPAVDDGGTERPFGRDELGVTDYVRLAARIDTVSAGRDTAATDGGRPSDTDDSDQTPLQQLFEEVTGTTTVVSSQDTRKHGRAVVDSDEQLLSETVAAVVREDGLDDTLAEPEVEKQS